MSKGLRITRRFTEAGKNAYDKIEWSRRDSRITNPDGSIVFEMTDAEIPAGWSQVAADIMVSKYFRKAGVPQFDDEGNQIFDESGQPVLGPERSARQVFDRLAGTWRHWGEKEGYFASTDDAVAFEDELKYMLANQMAAPNSPQWFNTGLNWAYGLTGPAQGFWFVDGADGELKTSPDSYSRPAPHACFILGVRDDLVNPGGIMDLWVREARIFKFGSGAGSNFSQIRGENERLSGGGKSSGVMSFLKIGDRAAGAIKSGGTTRRAAKMVILDVDHPDIEKFIDWKKVEEDKARVLINHGGLPADFNGDAYATVSGQNSNNSVRITNDFVQSVLEDGDWDLINRTDGSVRKTVKARDLWNQIAEAAWACADPGLQFDTTVNEWHTSPAGGRIRGSNPCFTGEMRVATDKGLIPFKSLVTRVAEGESFQVYTHDATNADSPAETIDLTTPTQVMVTGTNQILRLEFSDGRVLRCTPNHRLWTSNRGWVRADELTDTDQIRLLDQEIDFGMASWAMPVSTDVATYQHRPSSRKYAVNLPEKWTEDFAHYLGWLVGDGSMTGSAAVTVYGSSEEQQTAMLLHRELLAELNGGVAPKPTAMGNGTFQLRVTRNAARRFLQALGVKPVKAVDKRVPWSIFEAPKPIVAAFLRGLYDADGCVRYGDTTRYVGLASASKDLLRDVQQLLDTFGVHGSIYSSIRNQAPTFEYTTTTGEARSYRGRSEINDLRVMGSDLRTFFDSVGFGLAIKDDILHQVLTETTRYATRHWVRLRSRAEDGWETTYNLTEPKNHSYLTLGILTSNCSEYMFLDDTACNLASINLVKFHDDEAGVFDVEAYQHAVRLWTIVLEISVAMAHFPSPEIAQGSYDYRTLGLGYANLGSLLMRQGIAYDSDEGRAISGALTAILTGYSYATSAEMAGVVGPFPRFAENRDAMLRVMRNHRRAAYGDTDYEDVSHKVMAIDPDLCPADFLAAARTSWDLALEQGERQGYRNAQASVIAPTGCLVGGSLIPTERGLVRLRSLGDPNGAQWQDLGIDVATDEGASEATKFYVNGVEPVVTVETARGYRIQGTPTHRIKVVGPDGTWAWKRFGEIAADDLVPLQLEQLVGEPQVVQLPPLGQMHWTGDFSTRVPRNVTPELAEFVGYFMGDGSLHAKGIRLAVAAKDFDVVERLSQLGKELFGLEARLTKQTGYTEVAFHSVPLALWWEASGFAKRSPREGHTGKGWHPHIPDAVVHSNDPEVYSAFLRGLFEADGTVLRGYPSWSTTSSEFSHDVQTLLLALGIPTTRKFDTTGWGNSPLAVLRVLNLSYGRLWSERVGFMSGRKQSAMRTSEIRQAARMDYVPMTRHMIDRLAPENDHLRKTMLLSMSRLGLVSRRSARDLFDRTGDAELGHLLGFFYDRVATAELGEEELTYDLSVPDNVTYVANGFVSHNTIGLLMDCDTTGVEPDFALVKFKKLAGGGYFKIANQSVTPALRHLGYDEGQIKEVVEYIVGTSSLDGAPHINRESLAAKGFNDEDLDKVEKALPAIFELRHAFNVFTFGEETLQRLGFGVDEYTGWEFNLLKALGFTSREIAEANDHICGRQTIEGAPHIEDEHLSVFDTANKNGKFGERFIHHYGHIKMMAAAQPFISGAISKTINMPHEITVEDIEEAYRMSWEWGLKAMALYRDGSKAAQPLNSTSDEGEESEDEAPAITAAVEAEKAIHWGNLPAGISPTQAYRQGMKPPRFLLPARRAGYNQEARIGGHKVFLRTGEYEDGTLGEIFIDLAKEGATLKGILSCFAIAVSKGLQYGVPLEEFVDTFTFQTFEPRGMVEGHPNIKMANSIVDYVFRALGVEYLARDELAQVPPNRDGELPEPPNGLAIEAGIQLDLTDAVAETDVDAVRQAAAFVDAPESPSNGKVAVQVTEKAQVEEKVTVVAGSASLVDSALKENMGDAPVCSNCGHMTIRNGSCYVCLTCGDTTGCS